MNEMKTTLCAVFDNYSDAQRAREELNSIGLVTDDTRKSDAHDRTNWTETATGESDRGQGFFAKLFGMDVDDDERRDTYNRHFGDMDRRYGDMSSKHWVIVETTGDNHHRATDIVERCGGRIDHDVGKHFSENRDVAQRLVLTEEELKVHKHRDDSGEVIVRKEVVTDNKTIEVPVSREEVVIERRSMSGDERVGAMATSDLKDGEEVRIPVSSEHIEVEKRTVPREEVTIGKRTVEDTETVSDTVSHEEARVEKIGRTNVHDKTKKTDRLDQRDRPSA